MFLNFLKVGLGLGAHPPHPCLGTVFQLWMIFILPGSASILYCL